MQDLDQGRVYASSRGELDIATMAIPHAARAADKLAREIGEAAPACPLYRALMARAGKGGTCSGVATLDGSGELLRGDAGRFSGAVYRDTYRKGAA